MSNRITVDLGMPKVTRLVDPSQMGNRPNSRANHKVHDFMVPLIERLSARRPHWEFVSTSGYAQRNDEQTDTSYYARFTIKEDGDDIGWIDCEDRHHGLTYLFDNHRLRAKRTRGQATMSIKIDVAYKGVIENMYGLTVAERIDTARNALSGQTQRASQSAMREVRERRGKLAMAFENYAIKHWQQFRGTLNELGRNLTSDFLDIKAVEGQMVALDKARTDGTGVTVVIKGDSYLVGTAAPTITNTRYTTDTLPEGIKTNLGMLKLCEVNVPMPGIGIKTHKDQYLVIVGTPDPVEES